jgi:cytochrome c biogenesis protein CcdA
MSAPVRLREPAAIAGELNALRAARSLPEGFRTGARAALLWATQGGAGPLTGALVTPPPPMRVIVAELSAAEAIIYGRPSTSRDFAVGVEYALMWVECATPTPPSVRSMPATGERATGFAVRGQADRPTREDT